MVSWIDILKWFFFMAVIFWYRKLALKLQFWHFFEALALFQFSKDSNFIWLQFVFDQKTCFLESSKLETQPQRLTSFSDSKVCDISVLLHQCIILYPILCRWNESIAAGQSRPKSAPAFRPRFCFLDKKVLRFYSYFEETAGKIFKVVAFSG